jgi:hypothetical protein
MESNKQKGCGELETVDTTVHYGFSTLAKAGEG